MKTHEIKRQPYPFPNGHKDKPIKKVKTNKQPRIPKNLKYSEKFKNIYKYQPIFEHIYEYPKISMNLLENSKIFTDIPEHS